MRKECQIFKREIVAVIRYNKARIRIRFRARTVFAVHRDFVQNVVGYAFEGYVTGITYHYSAVIRMVTVLTVGHRVDSGCQRLEYSVFHRYSVASANYLNGCNSRKI